MTEGYRSNRLTPTADTVLLEPPAQSKARRVLNAGLDLASVPLVHARKHRTQFDGRQVELEPRGWSWRTERSFEISLCAQAVKRHASADVLEVGNVLPLAGIGGHTVVDKYEAGPGVINQDILDFAPDRTYSLVVSISTVEHIGWDEIPQDLDKSLEALRVMRRLVAPGGAMLVTIPAGYRREFEPRFLEAEVFEAMRMFAKVSRFGTWREVNAARHAEYQYGEPYACGNAVLVGSVGSPLQE